jgi:DEAD/DEAH box helicase domain-containing protein
MRLPPSARRACDAAGIPFREAVHAAGHALLNVVPLHLVCNTTDLGTECDNPYDTRFRPERLLLYDKHPGGIGLAAQVGRGWQWSVLLHD